MSRSSYCYCCDETQTGFFFAISIGATKVMVAMTTILGTKDDGNAFVKLDT